MGWTETTATYYTQKGDVNRKAECDAYWEESLNRGHYKVVKSTMKGSVYYGAIMILTRQATDDNGIPKRDDSGRPIREQVPEDERQVVGVVMRTYIRDKYSFGYRVISETEGPNEQNAPKSILMALSPTNDEYAQNWRQKCWDNLSKLTPKDLAPGTKIKFEQNGREWILTKQNPSYQFKNPWWSCFDKDGTFRYFSKKRIPNDFEILYD